MKKFLSILASLTIITSSATGVIACGTNNESKTSSIIENNNKANLLGAAFNEAKAIIFDDQYKLSQKVSNEAINSLEASQFITDYTPQGDLTTKSSVKEVINQYFGNEDDYTNNLDATEDKTVQLNNTKGEVSGLRTFIESKTSNEKIINSIL
jgi:MOLPALP family lipoprotein